MNFSLSKMIYNRKDDSSKNSLLPSARMIRSKKVGGIIFTDIEGQKAVYYIPDYFLLTLGAFHNR